MTDLRKGVAAREAKRAQLIAAVDRLSTVIENGELLAATDPADLLNAAREEIARLRAEAVSVQAIVAAAKRLCVLGEDGGIDDNPLFSDEWSALEDAVKAAAEHVSVTHQAPE